MRSNRGLPPWKARCERDREWMIEWSIAEMLALDNERQHDDVPQSAWENIPAPSRDMRLRAAKERARRNGDLAPLHALYPEIAEFIHEPKRVRGQRRPYVKPMKGNIYSWAAREEAEQMAVDIVRELREIIWPKYYNGRWKRRRDDGPSAEEIAGGFCGLTADEVRAAIKAR